MKLELCVRRFNTHNFPSSCHTPLRNWYIVQIGIGILHERAIWFFCAIIHFYTTKCAALDVIYRKNGTGVQCSFGRLLSENQNRATKRPTERCDARDETWNKWANWNISRANFTCRKGNFWEISFCVWFAEIRSISPIYSLQFIRKRFRINFFFRFRCFSSWVQNEDNDL